jgi:hypothetical protein
MRILYIVFIFLFILLFIIWFLITYISKPKHCCTKEKYMKILHKKQKLNDRLIFNLSQIGFALRSNLCYTNRINIGIKDYTCYLKYLNHGDRLFISVYETNVNIQKIVSIIKDRDIKLVFYLMGEPLVPLNLIMDIYPVAIRVFVQNNIYDLPNVHIMPIGIRDCGSIVDMHKKTYYQKDLLDAPKFTLSKKIYKCLLCFSLSTHPSRVICENTLKNLPFVRNLNSDEGKFVQTKVVYSETIQSKYVLSPRGIGEDCHRFYETIYLKSIPIVLRTNNPFDKLYEQFPCLVVDNWKDVTEDLLDKEYDNCMRKLNQFLTKYPNFLSDIDSLDELMLLL